MPRPPKGPRLHKFSHTPVWYIKDTGQSPRSTGCTSREDAEKVLADYIRGKGRIGGAHEPENITVGEILTIYAEGHALTVEDPERIGYAIEALLPFWADMKVSHVKGETCRRYVKERNRAPGTTRRELGTLQAALIYAHKEGYLTAAPTVTLPPKPEPRDRWLTRDEAARLLWAAYRGHKSQHVARFILISLYTGTRKDATLRMGFQPNTVGGWFDLDRGIMYRKGAEERTTNKRRLPAPIPRNLLSHLRRWHASGALWAVEYEGKRVGDVKRSFAHAVRDAGLDDVTPHTLKHTAITWALQNGAPAWEAAGYFSTSQETIERVYGHHSPDYQSAVLAAVERRAKR